MKAIKYDEIVKESRSKWCAKPYDNLCACTYDSMAGKEGTDKEKYCYGCIYHTTNYSKLESQITVPTNCSTCLHDKIGEYCWAAHSRKTWLGDKCVDWKLDLSKKELEKTTEEFLNIINDPIEVQYELRAREIRDELREKYPHGHPKFIDLILDEVRLHSDKNHDFAKGGNPLGNFNRVGAILDLYPGLSPGDPVIVAISFMLKQLDASLWMYSQETKAKVEGHAERWRDIAIYAKIISILIEEGIPF